MHGKVAIKIGGLTAVVCILCVSSGSGDCFSNIRIAFDCDVLKARGINWEIFMRLFQAPYCYQPIINNDMPYHQHSEHQTNTTATIAKR